MNVTLSAHNARVFGTAHSSVKHVRYGRTPTAQGAVMRVIFNVLCKLGFLLWCCFPIFLLPTVSDVVHSHDMSNEIDMWRGVVLLGYLMLGIVLVKGSRIPKSFRTRIEAMKREGFRPEPELVNQGEFAGFSRPQNKAVFMRWYDDTCIVVPLSSIKGVKLTAPRFIEVHTTDLNMPRIGLHVRNGQVNDWLARLDTILFERAAA